MIDRVYLSAGDRQLSPFLPDSAFEESLVLNVLFQPSQLVIPDVFCFFPAVEAHVLDHAASTSLLEAALSEGLLIPRMRDPDAAGFVETFHVMSGGRGPIRGVGHRAKELAYRLDASLHPSGFDVIEYWPSVSVGERYEKLVRSVLQQDEPPDAMLREYIDADFLLDLWKRTKRWRYDGIDEGIRLTRTVGGQGLRRGEMNRAIARLLGLATWKTTEGPRDILSRAPESQQGELRALFRWTAYLYHLNQADLFDSAVTVPGFDGIASMIFDAGDAMGPRAQQDAINVLELPSLHALRQLPGQDLIAIRREEGRDFFAAVRAWSDDPSDATKARLLSVSEVYADAIRDRVEGKTASDLVMDLIPGEPSGYQKALVAGAAGVTMAAGSVAFPYLPVFVGAAGLGLVMLSRRKPAGADVPVRFQAGGARPEVVLPTHTNRDDS